MMSLVEMLPVMLLLPVSTAAADEGNASGDIAADLDVSAPVAHENNWIHCRMQWELCHPEQNTTLMGQSGHFSNRCKTNFD